MTNCPFCSEQLEQASAACPGCGRTIDIVVGGQDSGSIKLRPDDPETASEQAKPVSDTFVSKNPTPPESGTAANHEDPPSLKEWLGERYEVVETLGKGAFGEVYRARDSMLERDVAVKRVRLDAFADENQLEEVKARAIREAKVAAQLKHPNIVTIYDIIASGGMSFIVMEFVDGPTLEGELKKKGRLSLDETLDILSQMADALDYAHGETVVHRDIKPANIMLESSGRIKVTDFGIAKSEGSKALTANGSILGTPYYMSPEQAQGELDVDGRADLFSLACIAFECLSGHKPYSAENAIGTLMKIINEDAPVIDCGGLSLHPDIAAVFQKAMAKEPEDRYRVIGDFVQSLMDAQSRDVVESADVDDTTQDTAPTPRQVTSRKQGATTSFDIAFQGKLEDKPLVDVIQGLYAARKTGILHCQRDIGKRIYFKRGTIIFANSDVIEDRLGEFLIRVGAIKRSDFEVASTKMKTTGARFGKTLVQLELLDSDRMEQLVRDQIQAIIASLLDWETGFYGFEGLDEPVEEDIVLELSTADVILEGVRNMQSMDKIRAAVGDTGQRLIHSENPLLLYQKVSLTSNEGFVLSRVTGDATISDIVSLSPLGEEQTLKCIYGLVAAGVLDIEDTITQRNLKSPATSGADPQGPSPSRTTTSISSPLEPEIVFTPGSNPAVPRPNDTQANEEEEDEQVILDEIAEKHAALAEMNHYQLLEITHQSGAQEIRAAYYRMVKKYHPDRHHSPNLKKVHGLLEELFQRVAKAHEILSNPTTRKRYDTEIALSDTAAAAVAEINRLSSKANAAPAAHRKVKASAKFTQGKAHFDQMAYIEAIRALEEAVKLDPAELSYHKLLAQVLLKNPKWRKKAEERFERALKIDEADADCHLGLAEIYEANGMFTRAKNMYRKVLTLEPANKVAKAKLSASKRS